MNPISSYFHEKAGTSYGGYKKFPLLSKTYSLMDHYNHCIPVDVKIMVSTNCPIIGD